MHSCLANNMMQWQLGFLQQRIQPNFHITFSHYRSTQLNSLTLSWANWQYTIIYLIKARQEQFMIYRFIINFLINLWSVTAWFSCQHFIKPFKVTKIYTNPLSKCENNKTIAFSMKKGFKQNIATWTWRQTPIHCQLLNFTSISMTAYAFQSQ